MNTIKCPHYVKEDEIDKAFEGQIGARSSYENRRRSTHQKR